jgi:hypothetical protein
MSPAPSKYSRNCMELFKSRKSNGIIKGLKKIKPCICYTVPKIGKRLIRQISIETILVSNNTEQQVRGKYGEGAG